MKNKDLVFYKNKLNEYSFDGKLSENEQVILFKILREAKNRKSNILELSYKQFKDELDILTRRISLSDFEAILMKLLDLNTKLIKETSDDNMLVGFNFFTSMVVSRKNDLIRASLTNESMLIFNNIKAPGFTFWELSNFSKIKGKYNRIIYRYLKTFASTGIWRIKYIYFKELLNLPNSYRSRDIDKQILSKAIEELQIYFKNLNVVKEKDPKSNRITYLIFTFKKSPITKEQKKVFNEFKNLTNGEKSKYGYDYEEYLQEKNQTFEEIQPTRDPNKLFE